MARSDQGRVARELRQQADEEGSDDRAVERAEPGDGRPDQDLQREDDAELVRLGEPVRDEDEERACDACE